MKTIKKDQIFVFGSNLAGVHGAGAAKTALEQYGAVWGVGEGMQGKSYAIPTKDENIQSRPLADIEKSVQAFIKFARQHQELSFFITRVGCGLAGYTDEQIGPFFKEAPFNCDIPTEWEK